VPPASGPAHDALCRNCQKFNGLSNNKALTNVAVVNVTVVNVTMSNVTMSNVTKGGA
jgi:hypothetical protein